MKHVRLAGSRPLVGADLWHNGQIDQDLAAKQAQQDKAIADINATYKGISPGDANVSKGAPPPLADDIAESGKMAVDQAARAGLFGSLGMLFSSDSPKGPIPPIPMTSKLILGAVIVGAAVVGARFVFGGGKAGGGNTIIVKR